MIAMSEALEIVPYGKLGAEVRGVSLERVTPRQVAAIEEALNAHDVIIFRNQSLTNDAFLDFSRRFGDLDLPPNEGVGLKAPPEHPHIFIVSNVVDSKGEPIGALGSGECVWHTDGSYKAPPLGASLLYALEVPRTGGDTSFSSMKAALQSLPSELLDRVKGLDVKHDAAYDSAGNLRHGITASDDPRESPGVWHPLIIEHPVTGIPGLYFSRRRNAYLRGLDLEESERLLDDIWSHIESAVYRHQWLPKDLVMWDNRSVMHRREAFDPTVRRVMHRTQIRGTLSPRRALL
jgi:taurine dioxygenase